MGQARSFNGGMIPFAGKMSEARFVAYTRFRGVVNTASRIWMVRDWAKRNGYHLEGAPSCLFVSPNGNPGETQCEVQWAIAEAPGPIEGEIGVRWLESRADAGRLSPWRCDDTPFHGRGTPHVGRGAGISGHWGAARDLSLGRQNAAGGLDYGDPDLR